MPGYEPHRPRPDPTPQEGEAQIDALLDPTPSRNVIGDEGLQEAPTETGQARETSGQETMTSPLEAMTPEGPSVDEDRSETDNTGLARADPNTVASPPRKRVQSLPPDPGSHGPGPLVPMAVAAVLAILVLLYLRARRRRP